VADHLMWVVGTVLSLVHLMGVLSAIDAVMKNRTAQGAIAWVVSLMTFPYISVPLYWVFGRNKFQGYVKLRSSKNKEISKIIDHLRENALEILALDESRNNDEQVLTYLAEMPLTRGNNVELLIDGSATFQSIFQHIERATAYVIVQFYIVKDDEIGRRLQRCLISKAANGVTVYFLYDEIGCHKLPGSYLNALQNGGVNVSPFHTTKGKANRFQLNFRNHRKIVVVDGETAFVGGHNVGDEYLGKSKRFGDWRDTHVKITGPAVQSIQCVFLEDWYWATGNVPALNWTPVADPRKQMRALVFSTGPADSLETCGLMFVHMFNAAQRRVWITSPYFVPDPPVISALQLAALRGVDVRILLPEKVDHKFAYLASFSYYAQTLPLGIKIYRYQDGFLHQKVFLVDDKIAAVGTANFDNRSFRLNFEITMLVQNTEFAGSVERMLLTDFDRSQRVTLADLEQRPLWFKLAVRFSRLLAPVL
jgi:cardiolipin synthase